MLTILRRRLTLVRAGGSDAGFTLVELLVTMVLMSIVSALALTWLIGENKTDTKTQNASFATGDARTVLQSWPALLRVADSPWNGRTAVASTSPAPLPTATIPAGDSAGRFLAIDSRSITFNADLANAPTATCADSCARSDTTQVTLALTPAGDLTQTLVKGTGAPNTITFVHSGAALAGDCLFTAYGVDGTKLGCAATTPLGAIARVALAFAVTPDNGGTAQTFNTSVAVTGSLASAPTASASATAGA